MVTTSIYENNAFFKSKYFQHSQTILKCISSAFTLLKYSRVFLIANLAHKIIDSIQF